MHRSFKFFRLGGLRELRDSLIPARMPKHTGISQKTGALGCRVDALQVHW